jgi:hypothetical protein
VFLDMCEAHQIGPKHGLTAQPLRRGLVHSRVLRGRETVLTVGKAGFRLILAIHKGGKYQLATIRITVCDSACRGPVGV